MFVTLMNCVQGTNQDIMKKAFLSMALLGLVAVGTVHAQDQDKKKNKDKNKTEQPADMKRDEMRKEDPNTKQQQLNKDEQQKLKDDQQKQYDPNQQPAQQPKTDPNQPTNPDSVPK